MKQVWEKSESKGSHRLVLLFLADYANEAGECWPGVATIADRCKLGERYVQRILGDLTAAGEIEVVTRPGRSNVYRLGVVYSSPQGVAYSSPRGEPQYTPGVNPSTPRSNIDPLKETSSDPLLELVNHFADCAEVKKPTGIPDRAKWLNPLVEIYHAANDDYSQTRLLIADTTRYLKDKGYTVVTPASIVKTATSLEFVRDSRGVSDV